MEYADIPNVGRIRMPAMEQQAIQQTDEDGKLIEEESYRVGEVYFEETGKTVPYIIVPRSKQDGRANMNELMINIIKWFDDIPQPQLVIDVSGSSPSGSYYEWAYEAWGNEKGAATGFDWKKRDDELTCAFRLSHKPFFSRARSAADWTRLGTDAAFLSRFYKLQRSFGVALRNKLRLVLTAVDETNAWVITRAMRSPRFQALGDTVAVAALRNQTWLAVGTATAALSRLIYAKHDGILYGTGDDNIWNFDVFKEAAVKVQVNSAGNDGKEKPRVVTRVRYPRLATLHAFAKNWPGESPTRHHMFEIMFVKERVCVIISSGDLHVQVIWARSKSCKSNLLRHSWNFSHILLVTTVLPP